MFFLTFKKTCANFRGEISHADRKMTVHNTLKSVKRLLSTKSFQIMHFTRSDCKSLMWTKFSYATVDLFASFILRTVQYKFSWILESRTEMPVNWGSGVYF